MCYRTHGLVTAVEWFSNPGSIYIIRYQNTYCRLVRLAREFVECTVTFVFFGRISGYVTWLGSNNCFVFVMSKPLQPGKLTTWNDSKSWRFGLDNFPDFNWGIFFRWTVLIFRGVRFFFVGDLVGEMLINRNQEDSTIALPALVAVYISTWQDDIRWPSKIRIIPEILLEEETDHLHPNNALNREMLGDVFL